MAHPLRREWRAAPSPDARGPPAREAGRAAAGGQAAEKQGRDDRRADECGDGGHSHLARVLRGGSSVAQKTPSAVRSRREEEEQPQPEVPEELRRRIEMRDPRHAGTDDDAQQEPDDDHGDRHARSQHGDRQRCDRGGRDDDEKRRRVDADHRVLSVRVIRRIYVEAATSPAGYSRSRGLTKAVSRAPSASRSPQEPSILRSARAPVGYLRASSARSGPPEATSSARRSIAGL